MKRLCACLALCLLLAACSVQPQMNADVFLLRLTADKAVTAEPLYEDGDGCFCFVTVQGLRAALRCRETAEGVLKSVAVTAPGDCDAAAFDALCERIVRVCAPGADAQALLQSLAEGEGLFRYVEGSTHRLSAAQDAAGRFFSITDAVLDPTSAPALTLRPETETTTAGD